MEEKESIQLVIESEQDAINLIKLALNGEFIDKDVSFDFQGWPSLDINIKGERYHSTLPVGVMKGLVEYQGVLNRAYAIVSENESAKSMSDSERKDLEVVFQVSQGSSEIVGAIAGQLGTLAEQAMLTMSGDELVITILGLGLIFGLSKVALTKFKINGELKAEKQRLDYAENIVEKNVTLSKVNSDLSKALVTVVKGAYDADHLSLGSIDLDEKEIKSITQRTRSPTEKIRIDDLFLVKKLETTSNRWKLVFQHPNYGLINVVLYKSQEAERVLDEIQHAFRSETAVHLYMLGAFKGKKLISAAVVGSPTLGLLYEDDEA
ncbi:hypothetical protein [Pseudomonas protegens]|uniref:hypothetical protein n=1 Tax=Pseudomonas protegens TaxID=380021 RepID=UPI0005B62406|nr:hypothetical protein [Pseudomonas protegens]MDP9527097.1 hypothetical protein [Pseudomonas protegens]